VSSFGKRNWFICDAETTRIEPKHLVMRRYAILNLLWVVVVVNGRPVIANAGDVAIFVVTIQFGEYNRFFIP